MPTAPKPKKTPKKPKQFSFSTNSLKHMEGVDSRLVEVATKAIQTTKVDFGIPNTGGLRSGAQQKALFNQDLSKADGLVHRSKHQDGLALDVFAYVSGKASWDTAHLTEVSKAFKKAAQDLDIEIVWGGDWTTFVDMPHYELSNTSPTVTFNSPNLA